MNKIAIFLILTVLSVALVQAQSPPPGPECYKHGPEYLIIGSHHQPINVTAQDWCCSNGDTHTCMWASQLVAYHCHETTGSPPVCGNPPPEDCDLLW